jgi:hypothetical protein
LEAPKLFVFSSGFIAKLIKLQTLRITILWKFDEKHPKQVNAYGAVSWGYSKLSTLAWVEVDGRSQAKRD